MDKDTDVQVIVQLKASSEKMGTGKSSGLDVIFRSTSCLCFIS